MYMFIASLLVIGFIGVFIAAFVINAYKQYLELKILKNVGGLSKEELSAAMSGLLRGGK